MFDVIPVLKLLFGVTFKECLCGVTMEYSVHRYVIKLLNKMLHTVHCMHHKQNMTKAMGLI